MSTKRDSNIDGVLPLSYRGRAEAFARHLHCRLRSLGHEPISDTKNPSGDPAYGENPETHSWLPEAQNPTTNGENGDLYISEYLLDGQPGSPEEELSELDIHRMITNATDNLGSPSNCESCWCLKNSKYTNHTAQSPEKDTTVPINFADNASETSDSSDYYDPENIDIMDETESNEHNHSPEPPIYMNGGISSAIRVNHCLSSENVEMINEHINISNDDIDKALENKIEVEEASNNDLENYCNSISINKELVVDCTAKEVVENDIHTHSYDTQIGESELKVEVEQTVLVNDDEPDDEEKIPRVRRCSSLKTGKTPPGTPGQKKIVRFADVLGLDLADVRTYLDEIPKIPTSAYVDLNQADILFMGSDLNVGISNDPRIASIYAGQKPDKVLVPLFQQPGGQTNFLDMVRDRCCCLENACIRDNIALSISGMVRVLNIDFHKSVHIRYTLDSWNTYADLQATYVPNSCDGFSDKFSFLLYCHTLSVGQRVEFAVRFQAKGVQYWDNNLGLNYCFQCLPATTDTPIVPITSGPEDWGYNTFY